MRTGSLGFGSTEAALTTAQEAERSGPDGNPFVGDVGCLRDLQNNKSLFLDLQIKRFIKITYGHGLTKNNKKINIFKSTSNYIDNLTLSLKDAFTKIYKININV